MKSLALRDRDRWLLEACLRDDARGVESFRKWRQFANPAAMDGHELRLMPLLHGNMRRLGLSDEKLVWIGGQAKHIWLSGVLRRKTLGAALDRLDDAGVDFILMKGAALAIRYPEAVKTRPMGDFDLLIDDKSVHAALSVLKAAGWSETPGTTISDALTRYHALNVWDSAGASIDLHWRPSALIFDPGYAEGVRARAETATLDGRTVSVASMADHLFMMFCHAFHDDLERRTNGTPTSISCSAWRSPRSGTGDCSIGSRGATNWTAGSAGRSRPCRS